MQILEKTFNLKKLERVCMATYMNLSDEILLDIKQAVERSI